MKKNLKIKMMMNINLNVDLQKKAKLFFQLFFFNQ